MAQNARTWALVRSPRAARKSSALSSSGDRTSQSRVFDEILEEDIRAFIRECGWLHSTYNHYEGMYGLGCESRDLFNGIARRFF